MRRITCSRPYLRAGMLVLLLAGACLPDLERIRGEHITYEYSSGLHLCAGTVEHLDRAIPYLEEQLGVEAPARIRYSWLWSAELSRVAEKFRPDHAPAFVVADHAMATGPAVIHELVHLVMDAPTAPFFREGVAVAYDIIYPEGYGPRYPSGAFPDPRATMEASRSALVDYPAAGQFVTFLLTRHGPAQFREFYESLRWPHTLPRIRKAFRATFGRELDDEVEVFMAGVPTCEPEYFALQFSDCTAPIQPWDGPVWTHDEVLECDADGVVGGGQPGFASHIFRPVTLEVPESGRYELRTGAETDVHVRFGPCFGCAWSFEDVRLEAGEAAALELTAGKYYLRLITTAGEPRHPDVTLGRLDP
jgi:hypothetical protein